jgi:hypothetical protein
LGEVIATKDHKEGQKRREILTAKYAKYAEREMKAKMQVGEPALSSGAQVLPVLRPFFMYFAWFETFEQVLTF